MFPNSFSFGGSSGASLILSYFIPLLPSTLTTILDAVLTVLAFIILGSQFGIRTIVGSSVTTAFTFLFGLLSFAEKCNTGILALDLVIAVILVAVSTAFMFSVNSSSGGSDIIAMIVAKYNQKLNIGTALLLSDIGIIILSGIFIGFRAGMISGIGLLLKSVVIDVTMKELGKRKGIS